MTLQTEIARVYSALADGLKRILGGKLRGLTVTVRPSSRRHRLRATSISTRYSLVGSRKSNGRRSSICRRPWRITIRGSTPNSTATTSWLTTYGGWTRRPTSCGRGSSATLGRCIGRTCGPVAVLFSWGRIPKRSRRRPCGRSSRPRYAASPPMSRSISQTIPTTVSSTCAGS